MNELEKIILENMTVLYIEDENLTRAKISNELKRFLGRLNTARNGLDGIKKFYECKPDVLITDLIMPDMTGIELAREVRNKGYNCPIIITSALDDTKSILETVDLGIEKYIIKPINIEELLETVLRVGKKYIYFETEQYIHSEGIMLDKERQKHVEAIFRGVCTNYLKHLIGKGPRKVEVVVKGKEVEVKAIDTLTHIEKNMIKYGYDYKMVDFNRNFLYKAAKEEIEENFSNLCNMDMHLQEVEVNSSKGFDRFLFSFDKNIK